MNAFTDKPKINWQELEKHARSKVGGQKSAAKQGGTPTPIAKSPLPKKK